MNSIAIVAIVNATLATGILIFSYLENIDIAKSLISSYSALMLFSTVLYTDVIAQLYSRTALVLLTWFSCL